MPSRLKQFLALFALMVFVIWAAGCTEQASWVKCTGSMEPAITCLDEVTVSTSVRRGDLTRGTVILFESKPCEEYHREVLIAGLSGGIAPPLPRGQVMHRITAVGSRGYRTSGDNPAILPDPCPVQLGDVVGVVIDIRKDVYPENATLRNRVNAAFEREAETRRAFVVASGGNWIFQQRQHLESLERQYDLAYKKVNCWIRVADRQKEPGIIPDNRCDALYNE